MHPLDEPPSKAQQCRRNAYYCAMLARAAESTADRIQLLAMQRGWLALADSEDWLTGRFRGRGLASKNGLIETFCTRTCDRNSLQML